MMTEYIEAIKTELKKQFPDLQVPDGVYDLEINGKVDHVRIENDQIFCCNFEEESK